MLIIDAHQDIAFNAVAMERDYTLPVAETRAREGDRPLDIATNGLPDALAGGVGLVFGTLYVAPEVAQRISPKKFYRSAQEAHDQALEQLTIYRALAERPDVSIIETRGDLAKLLAERAAGAARQGIVVLMENADPVREPIEAHEWQDRGVRLIGPAWHATRYCGGTGMPGPLTELGRELMREMGRAKLALDVSHMAEESFWQALDLFDGPVIASHSNCRALAPGPREDRHLSDAMIKALIERDGVIGTVLYNRFLDSSWTLEKGKQAVTLDALLRHIDHICQIAGDARHVAIGSDFDGGFGCEAIPREIDTVGDLARIADALRAAGFVEDDVAAVMGGNWARRLETILPE